MLDGCTLFRRLYDMSILNFVISFIFLALVADNHNAAQDLYGYDVLAVLNVIYCTGAWIFVSDIAATEAKLSQFCFNLAGQIPVKLYASWLFRATIAAFLLEMWVIEEEEYQWTNAYIILIAAVVHLVTFIMSMILPHTYLSKKTTALALKTENNTAIAELTKPYSRISARLNRVNFLPTHVAKPRVGRFKR
jgi:hypothetical protein